jgi:hypothetical protein
VKRRASRERGLATPNPPKVPVVKSSRQSGLLACGTSPRIAPNVSGGPPERAATVPRGAVLLQLGRGAAVRVRLQGAAPFDRRKMQKSGRVARTRVAPQTAPLLRLLALGKVGIPFYWSSSSISTISAARPCFSMTT